MFDTTVATLLLSVRLSVASSFVCFVCCPVVSCQFVCLHFVSLFVVFHNICLSTVCLYCHGYFFVVSLFLFPQLSGYFVISIRIKHIYSFVFASLIVVSYFCQFF